MQAEGEVGGADIDTVKPGCRGNRIEIAHGLGGLDHGKGQNLVIGLGRVVGARREVRTRRAEAALAGGRIAHVADELSRLLRRVDHWTNDAVGAGIEHLHDDAWLEPRHPRNWHDARRAHCLEHRQEHGIVERAMLDVDADAVIALRSHDLGGERVAD